MLFPPFHRLSKEVVFVKRWILVIMIIALMPVIPAKAEPIKWVDFAVPYESLRYAMEIDIQTAEQEKHISWIDILSVAACRTGGKFPTMWMPAVLPQRSSRKAAGFTPVFA